MSIPQESVGEAPQEQLYLKIKGTDHVRYWPFVLYDFLHDPATDMPKFQVEFANDCAFVLVPDGLSERVSFLRIVVGWCEENGFDCVFEKMIPGFGTVNPVICEARTAVLEKIGDAFDTDEVPRSPARQVARWVSGLQEIVTRPIF